MPYVRLETNMSLPDNRTADLTRGLASGVARAAGESEKNIGVELAGGRRMRMATGADSVVHIEIKGLDIPKDRAKILTEAICPVVEEALGVRDDQIYIAVISTRNSMWRVNAHSL